MMKSDAFLESSVFATTFWRTRMTPRWRVWLATLLGRRAVFLTTMGRAVIHTWRGEHYITTWVPRNHD